MGILRKKMRSRACRNQLGKKKNKNRATLMTAAHAALATQAETSAGKGFLPFHQSSPSRGSIAKEITPEMEVLRLPSPNSDGATIPAPDGPAVALLAALFPSIFRGTSWYQTVPEDLPVLRLFFANGGTSQLPVNTRFPYLMRSKSCVWCG
jgi:hypothetical protein